MSAPQPGSKLEELPKLQAELQYERARVELIKLRAVKVAPKPKRFRTKFFEWLLGGGALVAAATMAVNYGDGREGRDTTRHVAACERAHAAITDDAYNKLLAPQEAQKFKTEQLQVAKRCDKDVEL